MVEIAAANLTIREEFTVISSLRALTEFFHYCVGRGVIFSRENGKKDSYVYLKVILFMCPDKIWDFSFIILR